MLTSKNKLLIAALLFVFVATPAFAQRLVRPVFYGKSYYLTTTPDIAVKTNMLYDMTTTLNLAVEVRLGYQLTFDIPVNYNPWTFADNKKWKQLIVQPELRYWLYEAFKGHFFGAHLHGGVFNAGHWGAPFSDYMNTHRFEGWLLGAGLSYGYHWIFTYHWSLEATIGLGYAYMNYDTYYCETCGDYVERNVTHYLGPTRIGLSLLYMIK